MQKKMDGRKSHRLTKNAKQKLKEKVPATYTVDGT